jgi:hypothetical protein
MDYISHLEDTGQATVTIANAVSRATPPPGTSPIWHSRRVFHSAQHADMARRAGVKPRWGVVSSKLVTPGSGISYTTSVNTEPDSRPQLPVNHQLGLLHCIPAAGQTVRTAKAQNDEDMQYLIMTTPVTHKERFR